MSWIDYADGFEIAAAILSALAIVGIGVLLLMDRIDQDGEGEE